jgi:PKD repeat protein
LPVSIYILSPVPGNVVSGNVQVIGSATHPQFLQYQLEYGPDPNASNLWFPITGAIQSPVTNNLLGIWNTRSGAVPDGSYQLRLRVFLRDGSEGGTVVVNNIRVQNQAPTPQPTNTQVIPRPIAAFTQNTVSGTAPLDVQFTNQSIGQNISYLWNFGDGTTSAETHPRHTYRNPGTYTVVLTASNAGGTANVSRNIAVQSANPPVASFTANPTSGTAPLTVQFTDQSSGGQITRWEWNFGDGTVSDQRNPTHTYRTGGNYNAILTVRGPGGSSFATRQINVAFEQVDPPVASFRPNQPVTRTVPFTIDFQNTTSGGQVTSYRWDFGDGSLISTETNPSHTFTVPGNFVVTLTATGPGGSSTAMLNVVAIAELTADFSFQTSELQAQFNSQVSGGTGSYSYAWNFGDGTTSTQANPSHTYASAGTYPVRLTVRDGTSEVAVSKQVTVDVALPELIADFNATTDGLTVQFAAAPSGGTGNYSYVWDFGDGTTSNEANPSHAYPDSGIYPVTLVVNDGVSEDAVTKEVTVEAAAPESPVLTTPIMPDLALIETAVRGMFNDAMSAGRNGRAFVVIGDETAESSRFLDPLATPGTDYTAPDADFLDGLIAAYNTADLGLGAGINSFNRESVATGSLTAQELLEETEPCNGGAVMTRIECEIQTVNPAFAYISVGYNDIQNNTDPDAFQTHMEDLIQLVLDQNVVPIVLTTYPTPGQEQQGLAINEAIIAAADVQQVPMVNMWRAFDELPDGGLGGAGNPTVDPQGEGYISLSTTAGVNLRNTLALRILYQIGQLIQ